MGITAWIWCMGLWAHMNSTEQVSLGASQGILNVVLYLKLDLLGNRNKCTHDSCVAVYITVKDSEVTWIACMFTWGVCWLIDSLTAGWPAGGSTWSHSASRPWQWGHLAAHVQTHLCEMLWSEHIESMKRSLFSLVFRIVPTLTRSSRYFLNPTFRGKINMPRMYLGLLMITARKGEDFVSIRARPYSYTLRSYVCA